MLKYIMIVISVLLISTSAYAISPEEFIEIQENNIIALCEDGYEGFGNNLLYECIVTEFYGLKKVVMLLLTLDRQSEDWVVLTGLFDEYAWKDFNTYDFMAIHLEFENYLEEKN